MALSSESDSGVSCVLSDSAVGCILEDSSKSDGYSERKEEVGTVQDMEIILSYTHNEKMTCNGTLL